MILDYADEASLLRKKNKSILLHAAPLLGNDP
jgi:hypothetical protein